MINIHDNILIDIVKYIDQSKYIYGLSLTNKKLFHIRINEIRIDLRDRVKGGPYQITFDVSRKVLDGTITLLETLRDTQSTRIYLPQLWITKDMHHYKDLISDPRVNLHLMFDMLDNILLSFEEFFGMVRQGLLLRFEKYGRAFYFVLEYYDTWYNASIYINFNNGNIRYGVNSNGKYKANINVYHEFTNLLIFLEKYKKYIDIYIPEGLKSQ